MVVTKVCDGLQFVLPPSDKYAHPDKERYGIAPWITWGADGSVLFHLMFDQTWSAIIIAAGPTAVGAAIGTCALPGLGTAGGAVVGALVGLFAGEFLKGVLADKDGNLWVWISRQFRNWVIASAPVLIFWSLICPPVAVRLVLDAFTQFGYLQLGGLPPADPIRKGPVCV